MDNHRKDIKAISDISNTTKIYEMLRGGGWVRISISFPILHGFGAGLVNLLGCRGPTSLPRVAFRPCDLYRRAPSGSRRSGSEAVREH